MSPSLCVMGMPLTNDFVNSDNNISSTLKNSDLIIAEEQKVARRVLARCGCRDRNFYLLNEHSTDVDKSDLLNLVKQSKMSCLFSDQGTPCVADPGYDFVNMCYDAGVHVFSLPGPSSITTALSVSGFYAEKFYFAGFPPRQKNLRKEYMENVFAMQDTVIMFERPYVMKKLAEELKAFKRRITVCYNLGMANEGIIRGFIWDISDKLKEMPKAPFVVVLEGVYA